MWTVLGLVVVVAAWSACALLKRAVDRITRHHDPNPDFAYDALVGLLMAGAVALVLVFGYAMGVLLSGARH